jgi:acetyl esterase/lipase
MAARRITARVGALAAFIAVAWASASRSPAWAQQTPFQQRLAAVLREADIRRDLEYARPGGVSLKLDLYRPAQFEGTLPTVVFIHGGGWKEGDKRNAPSAVLAGYGYAVASIDYRLSQQAPFPAQIQDCRAAVRWLRAHAGEYRLNPNRFGAWGNSAGAHLAALLGVAGEKTEWDVGEHREQSSRVQAVCDFFGPTDLTDLAGARLTEVRTSLVRQLIGGPLAENEAQVRAASPLFYVTPDDPPFFIAHGVDDDLVPIRHSRKLHAALREKQVPATLLEVQRAGHGFSKDTQPPQGEIYRRALAFFDNRLKTRGRSLK